MGIGLKLLLVFGIGLVAGNVTGLIGASGVMVVVPAFILIGCPPADAIGASLFIDTVASLIVAWTYHQNKNLAVKEGVWIALGSIAGAQCGSYLAAAIPPVGLSSSFNVFLALSALVLWLYGKRTIVPDAEGLVARWRIGGLVAALRSRPRLFGAALGVVVGVISGLLGAGGGIMILLILVFVMRFGMHEGIGTSTLIMAFTAASGAIGHAVSRNLPIGIAVVGSVGTVIGGRISATYANKVNEKSLSRVAAALFAALSVAMFFLGRRTG